MGVSTASGILEVAILTEMLELSGGNFDHTVHKVYTLSDLKELMEKYGTNWDSGSYSIGLKMLAEPFIREQNNGVGLVKLENTKEESYVWVTSRRNDKRTIHTKNLDVHFINDARLSIDFWEEGQESLFWKRVYQNAVKVWGAANGLNYQEYEREVLAEERAHREAMYGSSKERNTGMEEEIPF